MKRIKVVFLTFMLVLLFAAISQASTVITFEDVPNNPNGDGVSLIPNGYGGFDWGNNMNALDVSSYQQFPGYYNGQTTPGGKMVAFNNGGGIGVVTGSNNFDFVGAYFNTQITDNNVLTIQAYNGSNLVNTITMPLNTYSPQWLNANLTNINKLVFSSSNAIFTMDDFTVNQDATPTPIPAAAYLLGSGLIGLAGSMRRKA